MGLVVTESDMLATLDQLTGSWAGNRWVGLYQNDWTPTRSSVIGDVEVATFSGYTGPLLLVGWLAATLYGDTAISSAGLATWTYDGGPVRNWIFGYYVVDNSGVLRWAQRNPQGSVAMVNAGDSYSFIPQFSQGSRYSM